uniref:Immunoglobulin V-set domain-containing protein n=1 Tax=Seriola dumerili TaxID=41447 RepID=A0A3B4V4F4_SERDU
MMNLSLITPLILCILSWISVSVSEFQTLRGRPGEEVTMLQINKTKVRCISVMIKSDSAADFLDLSDSGLYVCGFYTSGIRFSKHVIYYFSFPEADGVTKLMNVILGVLTGFLVIIIGLVLKFTKPWSLDSKVNDAALSVYSRTMRNGRPASEREVETRVFYCASR